MGDILETNLPVNNLEEQDIGILKEKTGEIIEPETCIVDNTPVDDGVICYI